MLLEGEANINHQTKVRVEPEEVGNGVISDHEMWVWAKFIQGVCHSHLMGTVAEELHRIEEGIELSRLEADG